MYGDGMSTRMILDAISESQSKVLYLGTHHYVNLSKSQDFLDFDVERLSSLQYVIPTGATVPESCIEIFIERLPNFVGIWNGYGLTETGMLLVNNSTKCIGKILPGVHLKVMRLKLKNYYLSHKSQRNENICAIL